MRSPMKMSATELAEQIKEGSVTVWEAVRASLFSIREQEERLHAFLYVAEEEALRKQAEAVQRRIEAKELTGPLAGVPFAVKDNLCTKGLPTTCGSRILKDFLPAYTAGSVRRLEDAGAILIGKTNLDEFAMGTTTETSYFGPTKNPADLSHVPGGSSGGSAAAVAAEEVFFALGSDTGGSIRQPASHCGIVGMKPSYGAVSRYGLIAYASSMDQVGPLARNTEDAAAILSVIAGRDEKDSTSLVLPKDHFSLREKPDLSRLRIGLVKEAPDAGTDPEVSSCIRMAAERFRSLGADVSETELPLLSYAVPAYYTLSCAESSSNLARFDGIKYGFRAADCISLHDMYKKTRSEGFGREVKRRIMAGSFALSAGSYDAYYKKASAIRSEISEAMDRLFLNYDLIISPVAPTAAPKLGTTLSDPVRSYLTDCFTVYANLAGLPALSVPAGATQAGLPVGLQIMGGRMRDALVLEAGGCL